MGFDSLPKNEGDISEADLEALRQELVPIFDPRFSTAGHGTNLEAAEQAIQEGLYARQAPSLETTALGLEDNDKDLKKILAWPHGKPQAIVIIMLPRDMERTYGGVGPEEHLWESSNNELNPYRLPKKYIKGYINIEERKLVLNPAFEENPTMPPPILHNADISKIGRTSDTPVEIPKANSGDSGEDVW
ncbi:MAG: hypothetical protein AAB691_04690 [Patescibacteria group bacterium]